MLTLGGEQECESVLVIRKKIREVRAVKEFKDSVIAQKH